MQPWRPSQISWCAAALPLLWGSMAVVLALLAAIPRNELNDVLVHFFDESTEFRQDTEFLDERLSGNTLLEYSLHAAEPGGVTDPAFLENVSAFADWYRKQPETRHVEVHHRYLPATQQEHAWRRSGRLPAAGQPRPRRAIPAALRTLPAPGPGPEQPDRHGQIGNAHDRDDENALLRRRAGSECPCADLAEGQCAENCTGRQYRPGAAVRPYRTAQHPRHAARHRGCAVRHFDHPDCRLPFAPPRRHEPRAQLRTRGHGVRRLGADRSGRSASPCRWWLP